MSDLLPILFSRGQNESIDPRVAPTEIHATAQNVRWRKDGRPQKRYGFTTLTTTGLDASQGYTTQCVNAVTSWQDVPVLALGSGVRTLTPGGGGGTTWSGVPYPGYGELSHWGPGERTPVVRNEATSMQNATVGHCNGIILYVWDDGTDLYYAVKDKYGAVIRSPSLLVAGGRFPRAISCNGFIHILWKQVADLRCSTFDPTTLSIAASVSLGTLNASTNQFDAIGRGADFVFAYQSGATTVTVKLATSASTPSVTQTQTRATLSAVDVKIAVGGSTTSTIWTAWLEPTLGFIVTNAFNNTMTSFLVSTVLETDANNLWQPGIAVESNTICGVTWGGFIAGNATTYFRHAGMNSSTGIVGAVATEFGIAPASKPFMGPAYAALGAVDSTYVWVNTHNSLSVASTWDDQRTYYLIKYTRGTSNSAQRHLHTPRVMASIGPTRSHLCDVLNLGTGFGYLSALVNTYRFGNSTESYGLDSVTFRSIFESQRTAARDVVTAGRAIQFSGGSLFEYNGFAEETGFSSAPVIVSITGGGGGGLTGASNYLYRAVFEWLDSAGRRHRSIPSDPFLFASGANTSATLVINPLIAKSRLPVAGLSIHIYRTLAGQSTYHRATPNIAAPNASPGTGTVSYTDLMTDVTLGLQELIYTDGGVLPNALPPPCTFMCVCGGRVWVGGQLDSNVITASKWLVDGEPTQFSDEDEFSVFLPEKCTGLASIDGTIVAFSKERIYFITGDGPNDQGIGSFSPPAELPTDVGCIDWRSVVETSQGIFFHGKRGIYLLPRGFNTPVFVGADVEETLRLCPIILSATKVSIPATLTQLGELNVRFVCAQNEVDNASYVLVYDLRTGGWSIDIPAAGASYGICGTWLDTFVVTKANPVDGHFSAVWQEAIGTWAEEGAFISTSIGTGDIRPFGLAGYGQFNSVLVMGEYRANAVVNVSVSVDGATADVFAFQVTSGDGALDGVVYLDVTPRIQKGSSIKVTVTDVTNLGAPTPSEGFIAQGLFIETDLIGKTKRLATARRL